MTCVDSCGEIEVEGQTMPAMRYRQTFSGILTNTVAIASNLISGSVVTNPFMTNFTASGGAFTNVNGAGLTNLTAANLSGLTFTNYSSAYTSNTFITNLTGFPQFYDFEGTNSTAGNTVGFSNAVYVYSSAGVIDFGKTNAVHSPSGTLGYIMQMFTGIPVSPNEIICGSNFDAGGLVYTRYQSHTLK
jgi:hypothetical protein